MNRCLLWVVHLSVNNALTLLTPDYCNLLSDKAHMISLNNILKLQCLRTFEHRLEFRDSLSTLIYSVVDRDFRKRPLFPTLWKL